MKHLKNFKRFEAVDLPPMSDADMMRMDREMNPPIVQQYKSPTRMDKTFRIGGNQNLKQMIAETGVSDIPKDSTATIEEVVEIANEYFTDPEISYLRFPAQGYAGGKIQFNAIKVNAKKLIVGEEEGAKVKSRTTGASFPSTEMRDDFREKWQGITVNAYENIKKAGGGFECGTEIITPHRLLAAAALFAYLSEQQDHKFDPNKGCFVYKEGEEVGLYHVTFVYYGPKRPN